MNEESKKQIQNKVIEWLSQSSEHTQTALATKLDISGSYINQIAKGTWNEKYPLPQVWHLVGGLLDWEQHIDSPNYLTIQGLLTQALEEKSRSGINGAISGEGKTYAIRRFCENTPNAYHVICRASMSDKALLIDTARVMGIRDTHKLKKWELEDTIADHLIKKGGVVVFDEYEYLEKKRGALNSIKTICDLVENKAGVVLCGLDAKKMLRDLLRLKKNRGIPQISRRFKFKWFTPFCIESSEIQGFSKSNGITNKHALAWLVNHVDNYDTLVITIKDAVRVARENGVELAEIDTDFLNEVFED